MKELNRPLDHDLSSQIAKIEQQYSGVIDLAVRYHEWTKLLKEAAISRTTTF